MPTHEPIDEAYVLLDPAVAARTAPVYARIRSVIPAFKWPEFAPDIDAILRLKRGYRGRFPCAHRCGGA